ncbi:MAG: aminotransferase class V-fold PLP-dependent enzyme, partial [Chthoniobacteraceae bacterium]
MNPLRSHWMIEEGLTFLNHGSFGACPRVVLEEQSRLRAEMECNPVRFLWREIDGRLDHARAELAAFIGADAEDVAFVTNATSAVNAVLRSLDLRPGDELVTTDHGYNACNNVLAEVARRAGAKVVIAHIPFPISAPEEATAAVLAALTPRSLLLLLDHITSPTALVLPVAQIVREAQARGVDVLVDGAHAP